jgi:hypothetical protein
MDLAFLGALLTACSLFRLQLQLPFECIDFFEKETRKAKDFFPGPALASKQALFCCLNLAIVLQSVLLWLFLSQ